MSKITKHTILIVDDEESILKSLNRLLRREGYELLTASGGLDALEILQKQDKPVSLIISDQKMPGISGAQFLENTKKICPDAIRFLLTGYSEMAAIVDAVNKGEIHRYLTKPWNDDDLIIQVRQAIEQIDLKEENRRLLALTQKQNKQLYEFGKNLEKKIEERSKEVVEKNRELESLNKELESSMLNTIRAFAALIEMHTPNFKGHGKRVSSLAVDIARHMGMEELDITQIEFAALLHDIGIIGYPQGLIEKYLQNRCSKADFEKFKMHPQEGQSIVTFISKLDKAGLIIRHHHERYDGSGYPDRLAENEIPIGSRIISIANKYDKILHLNRKKNRYLSKYLSEKKITLDHLTEEETVEQAAIFYLKTNVFTKYDPDIVKVFIEVLKKRGVDSKEEKIVNFDELKAGMVLNRALYTSSGHFLLPHKTQLTDDILLKLKKFYSYSEIPNQLYIIPQ